jgi:hypothetical protein
MNESFLFYIWQHQYFDKRQLVTTQGGSIEIFNSGMLNTHSGPDFSNAKIRLDGMAWAGSVEIHIKSSDWLVHRHDEDQAYENVILHVVWEDDKPIHRTDHTLMPTLQLKGRIEEPLFNAYKKLIHTPCSIPCQQQFSGVDHIVRISMLDRALAQRLETKTNEVINVLQDNMGDWEETAYQLLARNFGFNVNGDAFFQLGKAMPYKVLAKHTDRLIQLEALLFGQAGFLEVAVGDDYYKILQREFRILQVKYQLGSRKLVRAQWRFLRLRPANFPTVRIAQFSMFIHSRRNIFSEIRDAGNTTDLVRLFSGTPAEYWQHHYRFNKKTKHRISSMGEDSIRNILINSVVPLITAYGKFIDDQSFVDRATNLLQSLPAERNAILRHWEKAGGAAETAFDSQALIELYHRFCQPRNCLTCTIGASLLKPKKMA